MNSLNRQKIIGDDGKFKILPSPKSLKSMPGSSNSLQNIVKGMILNARVDSKSTDSQDGSAVKETIKSKNPNNLSLDITPINNLDTDNDENDDDIDIENIDKNDSFLSKEPPSVCSTPASLGIPWCPVSPSSTKNSAISQGFEKSGTVINCSHRLIFNYHLRRTLWCGVVFCVVM